MKINIYYGGRGLIEDPTIYTINKIAAVLEELRVEVVRYNLYEEKSGILVLPKTLKEADGVILATTLEWMGMGGFMQQFLDACWLYADKKNLAKIYMMPVVTSSTHGEREVAEQLIKGWELLGGMTAQGIATYVNNYVDFETDSAYSEIIEEKAEDLYRVINKKSKRLPSSNLVLGQGISSPNAINLTPQESEQLSAYVSDDTYVKKQKEDIEELTQLFNEMLDRGDGELDKSLINSFFKNFIGSDNFIGSFNILIEDMGKTLIVKVNNQKVDTRFGEDEISDVNIRTNKAVINNIVLGRTTFQGAFMSGELTAKGDFNKLRSLDKVFNFNL